MSPNGEAAEDEKGRGEEGEYLHDTNFVPKKINKY